MKLKYALLSALALGIFACEQPQKKEETKKEEPKKEAVTQKQEVKKEVKKEEAKPQQTKAQPKEQKQEQKAVAQTGGAGNPENGKKLFQAKGCNSCHQPAADTVGPSLKKIAQAYAGKEDQLVKFLKGEAPAIVDPAKFAIMKPQLMQLKGLSDAELKDLAAFILSHK